MRDVVNTATIFERDKNDAQLNRETQAQLRMQIEEKVNGRKTSREQDKTHEKMRPI